MRKKTQYIVVNEIHKTIYCGYPQKRAWKIITGTSGGMLESNIPIYYLEDNINVVRQKNIMQKVISAICRFFNFCGFKVPNIMAKISFEQYYGNHLNEMKKVLYNHNNWTVLAFLQPANRIFLWDEKNVI